MRAFLRCAGVMLFACPLIIACTETPPGVTGPNILLIVADDLGYTDLGAFGGEIETPNLDELAYAGLRLTNFHAGASCAPTRAMLLTGVDHHVAGMGSQAGLATPRQSASEVYGNILLPSVPTIAEHMRDAGYHTYAAGKWHLGHEAEALPGARGFLRSFVLLEGGGGHFDDTPLFADYGRAHWLEDDLPATLPADFYSSDELATRMIDYIDSTPAHTPFFAYLAFTAPHWPLQAPASDIEKYRGRYTRGWDELRRTRLEGAKRAGVIPADAQGVAFEPGMTGWTGLEPESRAAARARMEVYAAMVDRLDRNVGRVIEKLRRSNRLDNTVIVFVSDNGAEAHPMEIRANRDGWVDENFDNSPANIGTRSSYVALGPSWARASAVPFRASKSKVSEGGVRVPAFVSLPAGLKDSVTSVVQGGVDETFMRVMDLPATFLEMADLEIPEGMTGRSLLSRWQGGEPAYDDAEIIAYEVYGRRSARRGFWKALLQEAPYGSGNWQLYNLAADLGEQKDLADEHPEILAELIAAWQAFADRVGVIAPEYPIPY